MNDGMMSILKILPKELTKKKACLQYHSPITLFMIHITTQDYKRVFVL
jgi:hypothetical protein